MLNKVCDYYSLSGYKEYFGLKYTLVDEKGDHEIFWLDPFKLVGKQLKGNLIRFGFILFDDFVPPPFTK